MRKEDVPQRLSQQAFDFFFWFSRFEFALKESGYLRNGNVGARAEPGWQAFVSRWHAEYAPSAEAQVLLAARPERQIVGASGQLVWAAVDLSDCQSQLAITSKLLRTVRNNLFHGGKHGGAGWDDPDRTSLLLTSGQSVIDQFAELAGIEADYRRYY